MRSACSRARRLQTLALALWAPAAAASSACVAKHVVIPPVPAYADPPADFSQVTLYIQSFRVNGMGSRDTSLDVDKLRRAFADYVQRTMTFKDVFVETVEPYEGLMAMPAVTADVVVDVAHTRNRTWLLDLAAVCPLTAYLPIVPQWGRASVHVDLSLFDVNGRQLWQTSRHAEEPYTMVIYSWFRTEPVERAYARAYSQAFTSIAESLAAHRDAVLTRVAPAVVSPVQGPQPPPPIVLKGSSKIAVLPTQFDPSAAGKVPKLFDDYLLSTVQNSGYFQAIGRDDINALLGFEHQKDLAGCDDVSCLAEIGGALGVELVVAIKIALVGDSWVATGKLIDMKKTEIRARVNKFVKGDVKALLEGVPNILDELLSRAGETQ